MSISNEALGILLSMSNNIGVELDPNSYHPRHLIQDDMIEENTQLKGINIYKLTERGKSWMKHIKNIPFPTKMDQWKF